MSVGKGEGGGSLLSRLLRSLGLARPVVVQGVIYRPRPPRAGAMLEYDVRFASGERMRIRPGPTRHYPDLAGEGVARDVLGLEHRVRPGSRVLVLSAGAGQEAAYLARLVGPSGSVVALEADGELVRYARRRYPAENVSRELGGLEGLEGELDGAFDGALVLAAGGRREGPVPAEDRRAVERVVREGGWIMTPEGRRRSGEVRYCLAERGGAGG